MEVGIEYLVGGVAVEHFYQHGYYAFDYYGVGIGGEVDVALAVGAGIEPHPALASVDEAVGSLEGVVDRGRALPMSMIMA